MPRSPHAAVEDLLRDLGPRLRRGVPPREPAGRLPTGLPGVDALLAGGLPRGAASELSGPAGSGRTSLALALLARTTRAGEVAAVVDGADAFDPHSAEAAGARLDRLLWVRAGRRDEALRGAERLLAAHGFALVLLDLDLPGLRLAPATGPRLARAAAGTGTALVVVCRERVLGAAAELAVELAPAGSHFAGTPALLEGLEIRAEVVRHRTAPALRSTTLRLHAGRAA